MERLVPARAISALLALVLLLGLSACGDDSDNGSQQSNTPPARTTDRPPPPAPPPAPQAKPAPGPDGSDGVELEAVGTFESPVYLTSPPGDDERQFVVEQGGTIRVIENGETLDEPFLDVSGDIVSGGEQGLLSMAFAPDYEQSGLFYVYYTASDGANTVAEFKRQSATRADPGSKRVVLSQPDSEVNHNGGLVVFGPDRLLYVGLGDGGGAGDQHGERGNGQNLDSLLGKILRIDPRQDGDRPYTVPGDNPFAGRSGARPEIYSYGLRNPWRFSFDRKTGALTIGDVGQSEIEEIDYVDRGKGAGANFGWRVFEGDSEYTPGEEAPNAVEPAIVETHADGWCSITGGYVLRAPNLGALDGQYVYGDFCKPGIVIAQGLRTGGVGEQRDLGVDASQIASFGEDAQGRVYVVSLSGTVSRLEPR